jgi:FMN phosphatase YigB (HAD superfamily)
MMHDTVFLFEVDDTLLDNDRVQADLHVHIGIEHGIAARNRYWEIFEKLRDELGYADYLGALERYRLEDMHDPRLLRMSNWLAEYPFANRLYPGAMDAVRHVQQWAPTVILSDGDAVFQPPRWIVPACGGRSTVTCSSTSIRKRNSITSSNCIRLGVT